LFSKLLTSNVPPRTIPMPQIIDAAIIAPFAATDNPADVVAVAATLPTVLPATPAVPPAPTPALVPLPTATPLLATPPVPPTPTTLPAAPCEIASVIAAKAVVYISAVTSCASICDFISSPKASIGMPAMP
jgi:hypothetical protein